MSVSKLVFGTILALAAGGAAAVPLVLNHYEGVVDLDAGTFTFTAGLNRTPDLTTIDSVGRQADNLRLLFDTRPHVDASFAAQERMLGWDVGGVQTAVWFHFVPQTGMLLVERIQPRSIDDPSTGEWGQPLREIPYMLDASNNLSFTVPLVDLEETNERFSYTMSTFWGFGDGFGTYTQPIPEPETYALMLAGLGVVAMAGRRGRRKSPACPLGV